MGDNMSMQVVELTSGGKVRCRPVPPYLLGAVTTQNLPLPPAYPRVELKSEAGNTEKLPVLRDSPEYQEYRRKRQEWDARRAKVMLDFSFDYGIVEWDLQDTGEWLSEPPEDWEIDPVLRRWNMEGDSLNVRVAFIKQEVIVTDEDSRRINRILDAESPVTEEEVQQALAPFVSSVMGALSSGQEATPVE